MNHRKSHLATHAQRRRSRRAVALSEFMIAIVPVFLIWTACWQMSRMYMARLMLKHAAVVGARAAAVISNEKDNLPPPKQKEGAKKDDKDKEDPKQAIENAVRDGLGPWQPHAFRNIDVKVNDESSRDGYDTPFETVTVTVKATFKCDIPLAKYLACGSGSSVTWTEVAKYPHQGARYRTEEK